jgi:hypothetical protein
MCPLHIRPDKTDQDGPLQLIPREFIENRSDTPCFAVLSHRWREEEILLADMTGDVSVARAKKGSRELEASCKIALRCDFKYMWYDTCCIRNVAQMIIPCESGGRRRQERVL